MDAEKNITYLGYIRVSQEKMRLDRQWDLLIAAGVPERNIYQEKVTGTNPQEYIAQAFTEMLTECSVECAAGNTRFVLTYGNLNIDNTKYFQGIEVQDGYWLCYHSGHTGEWMLMWCESRASAKAAYKRLYMRYFRNQEWYWIVKV